MNKVTFSTNHQISLSQAILRSLIFSLILPLLSSCALLGHKKPVQQALNADLKTVHTLDTYSEKDTVHVLLSGIDKHSQQLSLKYLSSKDAGKSWSLPVTVNQNLAVLKKSKRGNDFQIAAHNNLIMAAWQTKGGEPWTGKIAVALSKDFGQTWQQIASPVSDTYAKIDQGYFDIIADKQGQFHITWLDDREEAGDTQGLRYARLKKPENGLWDQHKTLELTACTCCWSSLSSDTNRNIHVLYRNDNPRDMMLISSLDSGKSWQTPKTAGAFNWQFIGCPHQGGGITSTQNNNKTLLHSVIWNGKTHSKGIYYSQSELGKDKVEVLLPIGDNTSSSGDIAALNSDDLRVVYTAGGFDSKSVMTKESNDGGLSWSNEQQLTNEGAEPSHPRIVATSKGFIFFWTEWQENGDAIAITTVLE